MKLINRNDREFIKVVYDSLYFVNIPLLNNTKTKLEKLALKYNITDKNKVKELTEFVIVKKAREFAHQDKPLKERFNNIVDLYERQVNLSHRTSQSMLLQQYSTPAPIGFLLGVFCGVHNMKNNDVGPQLLFEPSAGNGMLTIAARPEDCIVNELDDLRHELLQETRFNGKKYKKITSVDASKPFLQYRKKFSAVITNPPFGSLTDGVMFDTYKITALEHVMALRALETMQNNGKAGIIIGGHTTWDNRGRIQAGKNRIFFNYLYRHYNVVDVINVDGHKLYSKMGTSFNVRVILIDGRKEKPQGAAPLFNKNHDLVVSDYSQLYDRIIGNEIPNQVKIKAKALKLKLKLL